MPSMKNETKKQTTRRKSPVAKYASLLYNDGYMKVKTEYQRQRNVKILLGDDYELLLNGPHDSFLDLRPEDQDREWAPLYWSVPQPEPEISTGIPTKSNTRAPYFLIMLSAIQNLTNCIKTFEGCKLEAYLCPGNVWTIGYGHTGYGVEASTKWTQDRAERALIEDANKALSGALAASPVLRKHSVSKQAAIADFIYNCGVAAYFNSTLKKRVDAEDWERACTELKRWNKAKGKVLNGLTRRRAYEIQLIQEQ